MSLQKFKVKCVKCKNQYESEEPDDYYCSKCLKEKKKLADEIDAQIASRPKRKAVSELQEFDAIAKQRGGGNFVNIKDLGITL